jgi:hypothetical protein
MGERNQEFAAPGPLDDIFEPVLGDLMDDVFEEFAAVSGDKQALAEKRRRAENRLEKKRLRDELGYYDLDLDDF